MDRRNLFSALFKSWCLNPAAVLSLCLVAEAYALSSQIIVKLTEHDVSIGLLMQLDKVILPLRKSFIENKSWLACASH